MTRFISQPTAGDQSVGILVPALSARDVGAEGSAEGAQ